MKNWLLFIALILSTQAVVAQQETLFKRARVTGGFGSMIFENRLGDKGASSAVGGGGGLAFGDVFVGAYGVGSVDFNALWDGRDIDRLDIGHGGFWVGLTIPTRKVLHAYVSSRVGWGAINVPFDDPNYTFGDADRVFVVTPEVGLELNVFRWFRLAGTVGYRYTSGVNESRGYKATDFRGSLYGMSLRFGGF
jgi:hypothetical protein